MKPRPHFHAWAAASCCLLATATAATAQTAARDNAELPLRTTNAAEAQALSVPVIRIGVLSGQRDPQPTKLADGTIAIEADQTLMMHSVVRRNADGTLTFDCVPTDKLRAALAVRKEAGNAK